MKNFFTFTIKSFTFHFRSLLLYSRALSLSLSLSFVHSLKLNIFCTEKIEEKDVLIENEKTPSSKVVVRYSNMHSFVINERANFTCHFKGEEKVQLHWLVNGQRVDPRTNILYPFSNYLGLSFVVDDRYIDGRGRMSVKCVARKVFWRFKHNSGFKRTVSVFLFLLIISTWRLH